MKTLERPAPLEASLFPAMKRWTVEECDALREQGFLPERYELIEGVIIDKMGQSRRHALLIGLLLEAFLPLFGAKRIQIEAPIRLSTKPGRNNEPIPDVAITKEERRAYLENPLPEDLLLVAEVADSSLKGDLTAKARLYSRAKIAEYWVIDLQGRKVIVHREPAPEGYRSVTEWSEGESVAPLSAPENPIPIAEVLE